MVIEFSLNRDAVALSFRVSICHEEGKDSGLEEGEESGHYYKEE